MEQKIAQTEKFLHCVKTNDISSCRSNIDDVTKSMSPISKVEFLCKCIKVADKNDSSGVITWLRDQLEKTRELICFHDERSVNVIRFNPNLIRSNIVL